MTVSTEGFFMELAGMAVLQDAQMLTQRLKECAEQRDRMVVRGYNEDRAAVTSTVRL